MSKRQEEARFLLRTPPAVMEAIRKQAYSEGCSMNAIIVTRLAKSLKVKIPTSGGGEARRTA